MALVDSLLVFVVSLLIGALGIYAGARVIIGARNYEHAIITAVIAAVVWGLVSFFLGWIPLVGPIATLIAYVGVINWRYPGGWLTAIAIALVAWLAALLVLALLAIGGIGDLTAVGIPGA